MRFTLRSLCFVFVAWAVAYLIACNFLLNHAFITWTHSRAFVDIWQVRAKTEQLYSENPEIGFTEICRDELIAFVVDSPDPWGNPYRLRELGQLDPEVAID